MSCQVASVNDLPNDVVLSPLSRAVLTCLAEYTVLSWAVLKTQCARLGQDPAALEFEGLDALVPKLVTSVARFSSPTHAGALDDALRAVLSSWRAEAQA